MAEAPIKIRIPKELLDRGERAAIRAGFSPKSARRTAARLLRTPAILARIEYLIQQQRKGGDQPR